MWDIYSLNFHLRGVGLKIIDPEIVKKFSKEDPAELSPLTNWELFKAADNFLPLRHGNIFHGSSEKVLKSLRLDAESAYPLVNEAFFSLLFEFLEVKLTSGSSIEKEIYTGMSVCDLVDRLLTKRCTSYYGRNENYLLVSGEKGQCTFSKIGSDIEVAPLLMRNCLTRDEIKLTGFLLISSKVTKTIRGETISVVAIGIPFPFLDREGLFDWEDLMITRRQNIPKKGFGPTPKDPDMVVARCKLRSIWENFYGQKSKLFLGLPRNAKPGQDRFNGGRQEREEERLPRYFKLPHMTFVDIRKLAIRLSVISMGILAEGNKRAAAENRMALIVIDKNKIGLGKYPATYETLFLRNFAYELLCMYQNLNNVFAIQLVEFTETRSLKNGSKMYLSDGVFENLHPNKGIEIKYSKRTEWRIEQVPEEYLVVETYRLDANAMPGNELWLGKVSKDYSHPSFDVRHSGIPFVHNPLINRTRLCGRNLMTYGWYRVAPWWNSVMY